MHRRGFLAAVGLAALAGCTAASPDRGTGPTGRTSLGAAVDHEGPGPPTAPDRLPLPMDPAVVRDEVLSGGPPRDGIPSIDEPSFEDAAVADDRLAPGDPVFGVAAAGAAKAYPQSILVWHEICNDVVAGTPVSVTYCPLTGTAMGFLRGETTFGVSGRLLHNNLVMYDRATEAWWPQVLATAVPGPWNEDPAVASLREFRVVWTTWERWRAAHPGTRVLSTDTGSVRNYDRDPYGGYNPRSGYYEPDVGPLFPTLGESDALPPKRVVIGARTPAGAAAFEKDGLRERGVRTGTLGGEPVVAVYDPALDTGHVYRNPAERPLELEDGAIVDAEGNRHAPGALPLEPLLALDAMWFAWAGFYPDTTLYV